MTVSHKVLIVSQGNVRFGIAVDVVREVLALKGLRSVPLTPRVIAGLVTVRGEILPALDPWESLGLARTAPERPLLVVVDSHVGPLAILVEEVGEVVEVGNDEAPEVACHDLSEMSRSLVTSSYQLAGAVIHELDAQGLLGLLECGATLLPTAK